MDCLLALMLFVYYKYTIHLIPKDIRRGIDITVEELEKGSLEVLETVKRAKSKVDIAKKQRKPVLVDQDGQPLSSVDSLPLRRAPIEKGFEKPF